MTVNVFRYASEARAKGVREGRIEGQAEGVLLVLEGRGIAVSGTQCERVLTCDDPERLRTWLTQAGTVASADELFR
ncbi:hypothetical protein [Actinomadura rupiterrae]|uniref:hypothetical protein n=1 Tax=Actinomadura rupiterrae TaxID=559627 RepID=UPI0020A5D263|nr:hypothetical protein [Actinomadura rupiterrae]MCP2337089.1 hypothetical protein [Actinomadura rupiterrae]